jgi:hypothetical protein
MRRFVEEADRGQWTLLPECLDDFIDESNPVRLIDAPTMHSGAEFTPENGGCQGDAGEAGSEIEINWRPSETE